MNNKQTLVHKILKSIYFLVEQQKHRRLRSLLQSIVFCFLLFISNSHQIVEFVADKRHYLLMISAFYHFRDKERRNHGVLQQIHNFITSAVVKHILQIFSFDKHTDKI